MFNSATSRIWRIISKVRTGNENVQRGIVGPAGLNAAPVVQGKRRTGNVDRLVESSGMSLRTRIPTSSRLGLPEGCMIAILG